MKSKKLDDLSEKGYSKENPARIYCDGIFDIFHYGHAKVLQQAKELRPFVYLIVGICSDRLTLEMKGKTVLNEKERYESVRHCKWVDEVIEDAPWILDWDFIRKHNIDFVAHDDIPYSYGENEDIYKFLKDAHRFLPTQRTDGISTSDIITRIVRDYDAYLLRNIKRGISAKDLNISLFKEGQIKMQESIEELKTKLLNRFNRSRKNIAKNWEGSTQEFLLALESWEKRSPDFIKDFLSIFNRKRHSPDNMASNSSEITQPKRKRVRRSKP